MPTSRSLATGVTETLGAAFSTPFVSLFVALLVSVGLLAIVARMHPLEAVAGDVATRRYAPERSALGITAAAVIALFALENVVRGYVVDLADVVSWWRYALPLAGASLGLFVVVVNVLVRGTTQPRAPGASVARRTWTTFGPRWGIVATCISFVALLVTTVCAGVVSSPDAHGRYIWLAIPVPNEADVDPVRVWFYGWEYGLPVLVCLGALSVVTWSVLHFNASRPYIRPETVTDEKRFRREIAASTVRVACATTLIALAGAWRFIAQAGTVSQLTVGAEDHGQPFEVTWRYAEFAIAAGWLAPVLEIASFVLLFFVMAGATRRTGRHAIRRRADAVAHETAMR